MQDQVFALLVHNRPETFESLKEALRHLSVDTRSVDTCREAEALLRQCAPHLIFADVSLPDGAWKGVLKLAEEADVPLNVIAVGAIPNSRVYLSAMEQGAFDFVAPPFELAPLDFVVRSAASDARLRREATVRAAAGQ